VAQRGWSTVPHWDHPSFSVRMTKSSKKEPSVARTDSKKSRAALVCFVFLFHFMHFYALLVSTSLAGLFRFFSGVNFISLEFKSIQSKFQILQIA
jgi:hypothetical protein